MLDLSSTYCTCRWLCKFIHVSVCVVNTDAQMAKNGMHAHREKKTSKYFVYLLLERLVGLVCRLLLGDVYNQITHDLARVYRGISCDLHPRFFLLLS